MVKCPSCKQETLKFNKGDTALYVSISPDNKNRPNYKNNYTVVKILGFKCFPAFSFNDKGVSKRKTLQSHDYICQHLNSTSSFPASPDNLYEIPEANTILKNYIMTLDKLDD